MKIDTTTIQKLREETGAGIMDAKRALQESAGDYPQAIEYLRKHGQKVAAKKQDRATTQGVIGSYVHANGKVAAVVTVACESDFVANTEAFRTLAHDIAMHVAAVEPVYLTAADVPAEIVEKESSIFRAQLVAEKKPEKMIDAIIVGKLKKYYSEVCLMQQYFIKDDEKTVEQVVQQAVLKLGENIQVKAFSRLAL